MSQAAFSRPESITFPTIFHTFVSKDGKKFCVQDLPEESFTQAIDLLVKHFITEETFSVSKNIAENDETREIVKMFFGEILKEKMSIGCFCESSGELAGINFMSVKSKADPKIEIDHPIIREIIELNDFLDSSLDAFNKFEVEQFLTSYALLVIPKFRGLGIATEVLKTRKAMLKAYNLSLTSTSFTTTGSQVAAIKAGYSEDYVISYEELSEKFPNFDFSQIPTKFFKKMSFQV